MNKLIEWEVSRACLRLGLCFLVFLCLLPNVAGAALVEVGRNYAGATYGDDSFALPPDANGTVGPDHFVLMINGRFSVFEKATGRRVRTSTDRSFWQNAGVSVPSNLQPTDPRVLFDATVQRWYAAQIDVDASNFATNRFLFAISATANPAGSWTGFAFQADASRGYFGDFPTMGFDDRAIYLSADLFDFSSVPAGATLISLSKSSLLADPPTIADRTAFPTQPYRTRGHILQPAVTWGPASPGAAVLAVSNLGIDFRSHSTLFGFTVQPGADANPPTLSGSTTITVPPYTVPINPDQPDGVSSLDNGDARISASVCRVGDVLYAVHAVQLNNLAALQWFKINATNFALIQSGNITNATLELFFPSIAANEDGTVVIGCNGTSITEFVSSFAFVGETSGGRLTFGDPILLQAGEAVYQNEVTSQNTSRWGDYSATTLDPRDHRRFWTIQTIPIQRTVWVTQVTEIIVHGLELQIAAAGENITLSWPAGPVAYQLETSRSLNKLDWKPVPETPFQNQANWQVTVQASDQQRFFRLSGN